VDQKKSQHYNYTHETIPIMWHNQTQDFLKYLDKDGVVFLRFWWKHLIDNLGIKIASDSEGMGYQIKEYADKDGKPIKMVLLTLPKPTMPGEVFYMALIKSPKKNTIFDMFLTRLPSTRVFSLELESSPEGEEIKTGLYELTVRARNVRIGDGVAPVLDTFHKAILARTKIS